MESIKVAFIILASTLFAVACNNPTNTNQTANANQSPAINTAPPATASTPLDELASARTTYGQVCARCHGKGGEGGDFNLDGQKLKVPSLKEGHVLQHTDAKLTKQIANGGDGMPSFKNKLSPEQIAHLVRFIHQDLQGGVAATQTTASPALVDSQR